MIIGVDLSSFQLNFCLLEDGCPPRLHSDQLGKPSEPIIERLRRVRDSVQRITTPAPEWLVLEDAFGRNRNADRALNRTIGAIIASVPAESQIAIVSTGDWRRALGAKNTKADGHAAVVDAYYDDLGNDWIDALDEHQKDSLGIALAWARILADNEVAS